MKWQMLATIKCFGIFTLVYKDKDMGKHLLYGFIWAIVSALAVFIVTDLQRIELPILYYVGFVVIFTPFIAFLRTKEIERKNKDKKNN